MKADALVDKHYGSDDLLKRILSALDTLGKDPASLTVEDLAPVDAFHTRGREATNEIAELAQLRGSDLVLDVGCGTGGTARHLAQQFGCKVVGIDLTSEYISAGIELTRLVGLSDRVDLRQASALDIPFADGSFDVVWTEHVQMNIADKPRFYAEIARVLKPGGRLLFHDIFQGSGDAPIYPVPWAEDESISSLATEAEARATIEQVGLEIGQWTGKVPESLAFFEKVAERIEAHGSPALGLHLLMGSTTKDKLLNLVRNLREDRVSIALGIAHKS